MRNHQSGDTDSTSVWTTDGELLREFDRPVDVADAVGTSVGSAIEEWSELSRAPPLYEFVDLEKLDGLFGTRATDDGAVLPSATFQFQSCRVTVLYGSTVRVIIDRRSH